MHLPRAYNRKKGWKKRWEKKDSWLHSKFGKSLLAVRIYYKTPHWMPETVGSIAYQNTLVYFFIYIHTHTNDKAYLSKRLKTITNYKI
jgi:hypothetical protein